MLQMINFGVFFLALLCCDQGICQLGAKLLLRKPFCWALIDHLPVDAMLQMINFGVFFLALLYCDKGICQLGVKLFAKESFLFGND